jgi:OOP family OmpA-OmpF porin
MAQYPPTKVTIEGHTDSRGTEAYNQNLSQRRADTIVKILTRDFNVSADRVSSIAHGETKPIASNDNIEGRQTNRRVVGVVEANVEMIREEK